MIESGLTSVTFRQFSAGKIVDLVSQAGLAAIEWGGDIHVPHGDLKIAREVARMTADAGLRVSSYGSYYVVGDESKLEFEPVLASALELGAPCIRVWAGDRGSDRVDEGYWDRFIEESRRIGDMAAFTELSVAFEFHRNSLTDTNESAFRLLKAIGHDAIKTYWQPPVGKSVEYSLDGLKAVLPWLVNVHVYQLKPDLTKPPLSDGVDEWKLYLEAVRGSGRDHVALLEFVRDDDPEAFLEDAATLKTWL